MLFKTRGIVLSYIKYRESSIIVKIYTETFGLTSYIVNGARSAKSGNKIAFYQPLTMLDLVVYHKTNANLNRISEVRCIEPFVAIPGNIKKSSIAIFITEILIRSLKGQEENEALFSFLFKSVLMLENIPDKYGNFHLQFLLKLTSFLGFAPNSAKEMAGQLVEAGYKLNLDNEDIKIIDNMINNGYNHFITMPNASRRNILDQFLKFYSIHIDSFGEIRSIAILNEVLN